MKFEQMILGLLSLRPFSGYELGKYLEQEGRFFRSNVHLSQIYRSLARMVDSGWVSYSVVENDGRPDAKIYQLTDLGEQELRDWITSPYTPPSRFQDPEFKARFLLGGPFGEDALIELVRIELSARRMQMKEDRGRNRDLGLLAPIGGVDESLVHRLAQLAHEHGSSALDQWIDWLETVLWELTSGAEGRAAASSTEGGIR